MPRLRRLAALGAATAASAAVLYPASGLAGPTTSEVAGRAFRTPWGVLCKASEDSSGGELFACFLPKYQMMVWVAPYRGGQLETFPSSRSDFNKLYPQYVAFTLLAPGFRWSFHSFTCVTRVASTDCTTPHGSLSLIKSSGFVFQK
jgi:hypothetical protein